MSAPQFYPDKVSAYPGEEIHIHASAETHPCTLKISRVGKKTIEKACFKGLTIDQHATPENADQNGCDWPAAFSFKVGDDWQAGYYDLCLSGPDGSKTHHFICVKKAKTRAKACAVIILATNTYAAYNYWGGSNAYADVEGLQSGKVTPDESRSGAIGRLSRMRPYAQGLIAPPEGMGRLINISIRDKGEMAFPGDLDWSRKYRPSPYDGAACFLQKWEHRFASWVEEQDIEIDYLTDHDFDDRDQDLLTDYKAVLIVGHSEYWSRQQREALENYVDAGGNLAIFSGNTCYWKVRWEDNGETLIAHKWRGEEDDPLWGNPSSQKDATHLWSHEAFKKPEAELTGLSFLYGGYHRLCMCAARGSAAYTIYDDEHWALEDTDLYYGDQIGGNIPLIGYENDGCPIRFGEDGLPCPDGGVGIPQCLQIIGFAPATIAESDNSPYPPLIPKEQPEILSRIAFGDASEKSQKRLMRGHAVMASFKRGKGEVFNGGTTEWVHGLDADDPFIIAITMNVLKRFGVL